MDNDWAPCVTKNIKIIHYKKIKKPLLPHPQPRRRRGRNPEEEGEEEEAGRRGGRRKNKKKRAKKTQRKKDEGSLCNPHHLPRTNGITHLLPPPTRPFLLSSATPTLYFLLYNPHPPSFPSLLCNPHHPPSLISSATRTNHLAPRF